MLIFNRKTNDLECQHMLSICMFIKLLIVQRELNSISLILLLHPICICKYTQLRIQRQHKKCTDFSCSVQGALTILHSQVTTTPKNVISIPLENSSHNLPHGPQVISLTIDQLVCSWISYRWNHIECTLLCPVSLGLLIFLFCALLNMCGTISLEFLFLFN